MAQQNLYLALHIKTFSDPCSTYVWCMHSDIYLKDGKKLLSHRKIDKIPEKSSIIGSSSLYKVLGVKSHRTLSWKDALRTNRLHFKISL